MTVPSNAQLNDADLELLSAYIDRQLDSDEQLALEERMQREPALRVALEELRATVALLGDLEPVTPPRSFTLDPAAFEKPRRPLWLNWLSVGSALAAVVFALAFTFVFVGGGRSFAPSVAQAPAGGGAGAAASAPTAAAAEAFEAPEVAALPSPAPPAPDHASAPALALEAPADGANTREGVVATAPAVEETQPLSSAAGAAAEPTSAPPTTGDATPAPQPTVAASSGAPTSMDSGVPATTAEDESTVAGNPLPQVAPLATSGNPASDTAQLDQPSAAQEPQGSFPPLVFGLGVLLAVVLVAGALLVARRR